MADFELYFFVWSMEKGGMNLLRKIGKFFRDSTLPNYEIGSDGNMATYGITTTAHQAKDVEQDDDLDYL